MVHSLPALRPPGRSPPTPHLSLSWLSSLHAALLFVTAVMLCGPSLHISPSTSVFSLASASIGFSVVGAHAAGLHPECAPALRAGAVPPRPAECRNICAFAGPVYSFLSTHVVSTVLLYAPRLNGTTAAPLKWNVQLLPVTRTAGGQVSARSVTQSWNSRGAWELCDAVVGSGFVDVDAAAVGSVDVPWLEPVVSTPALMDRQEFPTMLHAAPTAAASVARVVHTFDAVRSWSVLYDSTARAWRDAMDTITHQENRTLGVVREVSLTSSAQRASDAVDAVLGGRVRYVLIALSPFDDSTHHVLSAMITKRFSTRRVPFFSDAVCDANGDLVAQLPGSVCVNIESAITKGGAAAHNDTTDIADPSSVLGYGVSNYSHGQATFGARAPLIAAAHAAVNATAWDTTNALGRTNYGVLFHDAVLHYMLVANATPATKPTYAQLRAATTAGTTGAVAFATDGGRHGLSQYLISFGPDRASAVVGVAQGTASAFSPNLTTKGVYLLGAYRGPEDLPADLDPLPVAEESTLPLIAGATAGGVALLLISGAVVLLVKVVIFAPDPRDNHHAPKDETQPFSIAFTDIQASTTLWAVAPQGMSEAVEQHHALVRELIADHRGYEVKTIGDSFMVAFQDAAAAVRFAVRLQGALYHAEWPADIDRAYEAMAAEAGLGAGATDAGLWSGLRVRVGVHHGSGSIVLDPTTKGYDYYGTVVNTAARVETVGNGGQVLVTAAALAAAGDDAVEDAVVAGLGAQQLRGLNDAVELHQVVPAEFDGRQFPPLRLDRIDDDDNRDLIHQLSDPDTGGPRTSITGTKSEHSAFTRSSAPPADSPYAAFLRVLLSPLPAREKGTVLSRLVERWHVPAPTSASALAAKEATQAKALVGVAHRAGAAHQQLLHGASSGRNTDASQCHARRSTDVFHLAPPPTGAGPVAGGEFELSRTRCVSIDSDGLSFRGASGDATGPHALYLSHSSTGVSPKNASGPSTRSPRPDAFPDMGHLPCLPAGSTPRQNAT